MDHQYEVTMQCRDKYPQKIVMVNLTELDSIRNSTELSQCYFIQMKFVNDLP